ncbi:MAG: tRNA lysidine(34) synthetase TilS [Cellulomonadaceae bacterium]|jgi:tRNA(Ile)-lysidine synthase|nr:tRNA lysidine(34) synthetase TilS [Cellulomonadaceae bacterium]
MKETALIAPRTAVRDALRGVVSGALVLVACSGGADSVALAAAVAAESDRVGRSTRSRGHAIRAGAVVVDHGLQAGSDAVAERAAEQCRNLGLDPVIVRRVTVLAGKECKRKVRKRGECDESPCGISASEAVARDARYTALLDVAVETGAEAILLGHTLDDQAESVLLGLARGSGTRSLAAMAGESVRECDAGVEDHARHDPGSAANLLQGGRRGELVSVRLIRPFLAITRAQTEAACAAQGLEPWHDPTNALTGSTAPLRNRVRNEVMPQLSEVFGPGIVANLARTADLSRQDADALDGDAAEVCQEAIRREGHPTEGWEAPRFGSDLWIDVASVTGVPAAVRRRVIKQAISQLTGSTQITFAHVDAVDALVTRWCGQGETHLPTGATARRERGTIILSEGAHMPRKPPNQGEASARI